MNQTDKIRLAFQDFSGNKPLLVRSPGRINLIGEHVDYNDGLVLPAAIDKEIVFAVALRLDTRCRLQAFDYDEFYEFDVRECRRVDHPWANYLIGVVAQLQRVGYILPGFDCLFGGNIPIGAGLSSSAALECGLAFALSELLDLRIKAIDLIRYAQKAEHDFAGVTCGIMDQFANMFGKKNRVVRLDCRSMEYHYFPFKMSTYKIVLFDTRVKHSLAASEYNLRRQECRAGVDILKKYHPKIINLRDVSPEMLAALRSEMPATVYRRCKFVVEEIARVDAACQDLQDGNLRAFGEKMYLSHQGLQHDYQVSCPELDFLVAQTLDEDAVIGARMMGGGFGGCTINLVHAKATDAISRKISLAYKAAFGEVPEVYPVEICAGTSVILS